MQSRSLLQASIWGLDPSAYSVHELHQQNRNFVESNCYIDIWVELIHALNRPVYPVLAFTLAMDFEGDQWTFYKPSFADLSVLYGFDVQEMYLWGSLPEQVLKQLQGHKIVLLEADAFYLPDTLETDYQKNHVKTTIGIESINLQNKTLNYFHNAGFYRLSGEDFDGVFHLNKPKPEGYLPPYCEYVKLNTGEPLDDEAFLQQARAVFNFYLHRIPKSNPIEKFGYAFESQMVELCEQGLDIYHQYAFGSLRQLGSGYEFTAYCLRQLQIAEGHNQYEAAANELDGISQLAKALILKGARMVNRKALKNVSADFAEMAQSWQSAMSDIQAKAL